MSDPVEHPIDASNHTLSRAGVEYWSVDSAPKQFSHTVPQTRGLWVLLVFSVLSGAALWALGAVPYLRAVFPHHDLYFFDGYQGFYTVSIRVFILCFFISFCMFMDRRPLHVIGLMADMCLTYLASCLLLDAGASVMAYNFAVNLHVHMVAIASGIIGFSVFSFKLMERGRMPGSIKMSIDTTRNWETMATAISVAIFAAGLSIWVSRLDLELVERLRTVALLGGIGPGVFLFLPMVFISLFIFGSLQQMTARRRKYTPPVTIFAPAHNEDYIIAKVIEAADTAAGNYAGDVIMMIANNNSTDNTFAVAEAALAQCQNLVGVVFDVPAPGKANALNACVAAIETEFMIRVDADTLMAPNALVNIMRHFANPHVGVVGGLPFSPGGGMFDRARFLEALVKHGFYSVAFGPINSVVGVPGMCAAYRSHLPKSLGGFVEGMNGEDTDMSLRIGELGYSLVIDPEVQFVSEVPETYKHMREQRMRWFRSVYHISSRCREMLFSSSPTVRGKLVLPYMLINSGRRAMVVPLILFGLIEYLGGFHTLQPLEIQAVLAVMVGAPAIIATFAALVNGQPRAVLYLPEYLMFRVLRAYFTLESMLSISIKDHAERLDASPVVNLRGVATRVLGGQAKAERVD